MTVRATARYSRASYCHCGATFRMTHAIATFWLRVLSLPRLLAGITRSSRTATSRRPVTANSRVMMTMAIHADTSPTSMRQSSAPVTSSLSARGSRNAPATVTSPRERASQPSSESVAAATT